ncbi:TetR family transcriptional regulator [Azomonas agilis]|uniref:TetR family transcriptional regulator n=1 Tax=Azomonas agilis TaxID=116849 RepID=A0A562J304_9GAMM|nr:TetR/AcrR family transcriptional regulator [Azomonas agilis]TWH77185.1 TetR family transcriptional regulator [Azomonas agilis]
MSEISPPTNTAPVKGLRERKRRETSQRIAETALQLFLTHGYNSTTLDAVAEAAGISRRTFFSYFKSKEDIILFGLEADMAELIADLLKTSPDIPPLDVVRDVMVQRIARHTTEQMTAIDNLMLSSESLLARKQGFYLKQEQAIFSALCEVWRQPERRTALRMVAMVSIGAMRVAIQAWREQTGPRKPAAQFLKEAFDSLRTEL